MPSSSRVSRLSDANGTGVVSHGDRLERRRARTRRPRRARGCVRRRGADAPRAGGRVGGDGVLSVVLEFKLYLASVRGR